MTILAEPGVETVLVTGGTGFVGGHSIIQLLNQGYKVRTTIRDIGKQDDLKQSIRSLKLVQDPSQVNENLSVFKANLLSDAGWAEALCGCHYVLHIASPLPLEKPKNDDDEVIKPAKEGTLRVLKFSVEAGVKKVVFTSSFAAIGYGHPDAKVLVDDDWAIPSLAPNAYIKSKILAERAAWDFVNNESNNPGGKMKFTSINPTGIFGPKLPSPSTAPATTKIILKILDGSMSLGCPKISLGIVDVRDVAMLHIQSLKMDNTNGQRFLVTSAAREYSLLDISKALSKALPKDQTMKLPTRELPTTLLRVAGVFLPQIKYILQSIRGQKHYCADKAEKTFSWKPIDPDISLYDTVITIDD